MLPIMAQRRHSHHICGLSHRNLPPAQSQVDRSLGRWAEKYQLRLPIDTNRLPVACLLPRYAQFRLRCPG